MTKTNLNENKADTTRQVDVVIEAERKYLDLENQKQVSGLAISGGGIRSASFGLGVMQALVANDQLKKMDYMSTVSGGGYLGSALTWALKQAEGKAGTSPDNFPLGKKGKSAKENGNNNDGTLDLADNKLLDFIRQHSSYLVPTSNLGLISFIGVVVRSIIISLFVYFSFLVVVMTVFKLFNLFDTPILTGMMGKIITLFPIRGIFIPLSILLVLLLLIMSFLYSLRTFVSVESGVLNEYIGFIRGQIFIGYLWKASFVCVLLGILPYFIDPWFPEMKSAWTASGSTLFGVIVGIWQYSKAQRNENTSGPISNLVIYLGAFALVYGLLLLSFIASGIFFSGQMGDFIHPLWFAAFAGIALLFGLVVNLNLVGPHRIWRDRLMEAFMPDKKAVRENNWEPAKEADSAMMQDMCDAHNPRPYHIINTNIILANSPQVKFNGRGGDNFIISRLFCGCDATGWRTTNTFQKKGGRGITLATAMATSAAALNPDAAVSGIGVTRNEIVSTLLSILNLRLGYWTTNPSKDTAPVPPNFFIPGLKTEIMRKGFKETDNRILLSDGGHFENLAIYELIRRKLDLIVLSDGGADPGFNFDDLANAVEKVRVDFGAKIVFRDQEGYGLDGILPGTKGLTDFDKKYAIAQRGFGIADIYYNDGSKGVLVYIKLAMIEGLSTDVCSYKGVCPAFPHESTADQFFDEKQFEAYRELGYTIGKQMMNSKEGKVLFPSG